jgi:S-DNA-T family DNA segregation ATPase FtsK/SpoIIIE
VLLVGGVLAAVGIYGGGAGAAGFAAEVGLGIALGTLRYLAPPLMVAAGWLLVRGPRPATSEGRARTATPGPSPAATSVVLLAALAGLAHVWRGVDPAQDFLGRLQAGGGLLGMGVARPLMAVTSRVAAGAVLGMVAVALIMMLSHVPPSAISDLLLRAWHAGVVPAARWLRNSVHAVEDPAAAATRPGRAPAGARRRPARSGATSEPGGDTDPPVSDADNRDTGADDGTQTPAQRIEVQVPAADLAPAEPVPGLVDLTDEDDDLTEFARTPADPATPRTWRLPAASLLGRSGAQEVDRLAVERAGRTLEHALAEHGVETRLVGMVVGPTVTRYELELGPGVKVARVTSLSRDIAYAMATPDVRILAPIPGRQAIGVEVPNAHRQLVTLGDILGSEEARRADHPLEVAIGRDIAGRSVMANLAKMPHVLIAGATGAGKSSCINCLITSVLMRSTPDEVRMILIDPKRVELGQYNRLPHLLTQVVTNPKKAANALNWAVREMERRYDLLAEVGVRDIGGYNAAYDRGDLQGERSETLAKALGFNNPDVDVTFPRLPYIIVVVDELNDLMMVAARDVEDAICRIAQMARAVGIHLVLATQRPSVNVITGVIKANVPARLAFAVSSLADSRVILDQAGAERLVGRGDLLILDGSSSIAQRLQGAWVTEDEVRSVAAHWRRQSPEPSYVEGVEGTDDSGDQLDLFSGGGATGDEDDDELFRQARELVVRSQFGSTSMLQRKLRVGFARAGRLMDLLEQAGVVGPSTGSKAREVLMTPEELDGMVSPGG